MSRKTHASPVEGLTAWDLFSHIPAGVAVVNLERRIQWHNGPFEALARSEGPWVGQEFYKSLGTPEIVGSDLNPFTTALATNLRAKTTVRIGDKSFYKVECSVISRPGETFPEYLIVLIRDVSEEVLQQQKLKAIFHAGLELGLMAPGDLMQMSVENRIDLLKSRIIEYTQELLEFETIEIRLLDRSTQKLEPLLAVGMQPEAAQRVLFALEVDNGVTGYVAATGKSYLCEDTDCDPLYLPGAAGARSSLTVPLIFDDQILGTFNVESPRTGAFTEQDLQYLELFSREIAVALNTLELLVAEKVTTVNESTERIVREVACPVDEILNDATWILERYIGHEPTVTQKLQRILKQTRQVRQLIHKVGESISPKVGMSSPLPQRPTKPALLGKRILVADSDESVRTAAHELLGRFGCDVETAHNGEEALLMAKRYHYDAAITDIRLPDHDGYECFCGLVEHQPGLPVILMTGYGYDVKHCITRSKERGVKGVLYKPFRVHQLLDEVEKAVSQPRETAGPDLTGSDTTTPTVDESTSKADGSTPPSV